MYLLKCNKCGKLVHVQDDVGAPLLCCGKTMARIVHNTFDASLEKHMPSVTVEGNKVTVQVGEALHPMSEDHYIKWILLQQGNKSQKVDLNYTDKPIGEFTLDPKLGSAFSVYAYCNLHSLWKKNVDF